MAGSYKVISRMMDRVTGSYLDPGADYEPASQEIADRLVKAGVIRARSGVSEPQATAEKPPAQKAARRGRKSK